MLHTGTGMEDVVLVGTVYERIMLKFWGVISQFFPTGSWGPHCRWGLLAVSCQSALIRRSVLSSIYLFTSASRGPDVVTLLGLGMFACLGVVGNFPSPSTSYGIVVFLMEVGTNCYLKFYRPISLHIGGPM